MNLLFTAFRGTSSELLLQENRWQGLVLPNDKRKDAELLLRKISSGEYDIVFSFGQKPNIKDKVYIETTANPERKALSNYLSMQYCEQARDMYGYKKDAAPAEIQGDVLKTGFDCMGLADAFRGNRIEAKLSQNAGTSFCNHVYWCGLEYIQKNKMDVKMVFVHVPMRKNISDFEGFCRGVRMAVEKAAEIGNTVMQRNVSDLQKNKYLECVGAK